MNLFLLLNTKEDILKNVGNQTGSGGFCMDLIHTGLELLDISYNNC